LGRFGYGNDHFFFGAGAVVVTAALNNQSCG
jgi:hypothetical protein